MTGFIPLPVRLTDTEKRAHLSHFTTKVFIIDASLLPGHVISTLYDFFLPPTGKRSSQMIKWTFLGYLRYSHCEYWMAFIKCCCSNRYLLDCSSITDNEKYRTNLISPHRRRGITALNKKKWRKLSHMKVCLSETESESNREQRGMSGKKQGGLSLDAGLLCTWHLTWGISENQHSLKCE